MASDNHYQTLGVDRTADARAIKKAYFALVRVRSPEADPEAFQRLRAAYEVLSDPEQRDRYDHAERGFSELADPVAERLRAIDDAAKEEPPDAVLERLRSLAADHPGVPIVRERYALALVERGEHEAALAELTWLGEREPDNVRWLLHRGVTLGRMGRFADARPLLARALELDPLGTPARLALSEVLAELDRAPEAITLLRGGVAAVEADGPAFFALTLRLAELGYRAGSRADAVELLRGLVERVRAGDADRARFVAGQIASLAAKLFARSEIDAGNEALELARACGVESPVERPHPVATTLSASRLPERTRAWLAELPTGPTTPTVVEATWAPPFLVTLVGMLGLFGAAMVAASGQGATWAGALAALAGGALGDGARRLRATLFGSLRGFITVHPLWILRARGDVLSVYSLLALASTHGSHHHTNGVYTHTSIVLTFGGASTTSITVKIRDQGYAQAWLSHVWETRGRSLELLSEGFLEADGGVDLLAPVDVERAAADGGVPTTWGSARWALVGAALVGPLVALHAARTADERALAVSLTDPSPAVVARAVRDAGGRASRGAAAFAGAPYARARSRLGGSPLTAVVDDLHAAAAVGVEVRVHARPGLSAGLSAALSSAFDRGVMVLGASEVLRVSEHEPAVTLELLGDPSADGGRWRWRARTRGGGTRELAALTTSWSPASEPSPPQTEELLARALEALTLPYPARRAP